MPRRSCGGSALRKVRRAYPDVPQSPLIEVPQREESLATASPSHEALAGSNEPRGNPAPQSAKRCAGASPVRDGLGRHQPATVIDNRTHFRLRR